MKGSLTKQKIIHAAIDLFGKHGYNNVSVQEIASQVGIRSSSLYNHFESKEAILECAIDNADHFLSHLQLDSDRIQKMLETQTPFQVLKNFVTYYADEDDTYRMSIHRLLYMEMYSNPRILRFGYEFFIQHPVQNICRALDILMELGAIPQGDSRAIAELWSRTSLIYGYMAAHDPANVTWEEYDDMTDFIINLAVRGVHVINVQEINMNWASIYSSPDPHIPPTDTKDLILHHALDLFSQYGYSGVSMRQIAESCGIKASSIYNHFTGKSDIIEQIADCFLADFQLHNITDPMHLQKMAKENLQNTIFALSCFYAPVPRADPNKVYRVLFREQYANKTLGGIFLNTIERDKHIITKAVDDLVERGTVHTVESRKVATAYIHTMCSLSIGATVDTSLVSEEHLQPRTVGILVSLLLYGYLDEQNEKAGSGQTLTTTQLPS